MLNEKEKRELEDRKESYGIPKEDKRLVLVAKRREGKTQELIDIAYEQIQRGNNVLWVSQFSGIQRYTIDMFSYTNGMLSLGGIINKAGGIISFKNGTSITFKTLDQIKGRGFMEYTFKDHYSILDNAALDSYGFDIISINGELYDK